MLTITNEKYRGLQYPWGYNLHPEEGAPFEVADGIWWVRLPMPMELDHINIWLLEDEDGWTVVDTCLDTPEAREHWENLFSGVMGGRPIKRVICTHMHPDHVGLAGWLCDRFDCPLLMTREEYLTCWNLISYTGQEAPATAVNFYRGAGFDDAALNDYRRRFGGFGKMIGSLPHSYQRIVDRETLTIGGRYWQVIVGSGHSPEHACLYCPALKLLISGDQILPRITSNVSVFPTEPEGNPLSEWMASCRRLTDLLPDDLLVLPSHQSPFKGLHIRLSQLIAFHRTSLQSLYELLEEPSRAVDCFECLFGRALPDSVNVMAAGEALAHLNLLLHRGNISKHTDEDGVHWYRQIPESRIISSETDDKAPQAT
ncbi:metallo-beta-lactamase [Luminiphilus syltensis NOR5-1B]|uniref:Metallo-beta-lactamase n=1 Tax=Luminiphilus syltensis NOR5-1B TaxID=565045 RepID=B8KTM8_9GAMM|nr:MBL fold metallo-hydrolase [Luminiphilus syltensis]EED34738.1 metallo-beta-lactamase [Luminiphilus syltensis NOR5-1B]